MPLRSGRTRSPISANRRKAPRCSLYLSRVTSRAREHWRHRSQTSLSLRNHPPMGLAP